MTETCPDLVYALIREIRLAFNGLKNFADEMNHDNRITAAMRAVMEQLSLHGPQTVPDIARARSVSRQHIQMLADALTAGSLAEFAENPGHKRSKLLCLTAAGAAAFDAIRLREARALADIAAQIDAGTAEAALDALTALNRALARADPARY